MLEESRPLRSSAITPALAVRAGGWARGTFAVVLVGAVCGLTWLVHEPHALGVHVSGGNKGATASTLDLAWLGRTLIRHPSVAVDRTSVSFGPLFYGPRDDVESADYDESVQSVMAAEQRARDDWIPVEEAKPLTALSTGLAMRLSCQAATNAHDILGRATAELEEVPSATDAGLQLELTRILADARAELNALKALPEVCADVESSPCALLSVAQCGVTGACEVTTQQVPIGRDLSAAFYNAAGVLEGARDVFDTEIVCRLSHKRTPGDGVPPAIPLPVTAEELLSELAAADEDVADNGLGDVSYGDVVAQPGDEEAWEPLPEAVTRREQPHKDDAPVQGGGAVPRCRHILIASNIATALSRDELDVSRGSLWTLHDETGDDAAGGAVCWSRVGVDAATEQPSMLPDSRLLRHALPPWHLHGLLHMNDVTGAAAQQLLGTASSTTGDAVAVGVMLDGCMYEGLCLAGQAGGAAWDGQRTTKLSLRLCAPDSNENEAANDTNTAHPDDTEPVAEAAHLTSIPVVTRQLRLSDDDPSHGIPLCEGAAPTASSTVELCSCEDLQHGRCVPADGGMACRAAGSFLRDVVRPALGSKLPPSCAEYERACQDIDTDVVAARSRGSHARCTPALTDQLMVSCPLLRNHGTTIVLPDDAVCDAECGPLFLRAVASRCAPWFSRYDGPVSQQTVGKHGADTDPAADTHRPKEEWVAKFTAMCLTASMAGAR